GQRLRREAEPRDREAATRALRTAQRAAAQSAGRAASLARLRCSPRASALGRNAPTVEVAVDERAERADVVPQPLLQLVPELRRDRRLDLGRLLLEQAQPNEVARLWRQQQVEVADKEAVLPVREWRERASPGAQLLLRVVLVLEALVPPLSL